MRRLLPGPRAVQLWIGPCRHPRASRGEADRPGRGQRRRRAADDAPSGRRRRSGTGRGRLGARVRPGSRSGPGREALSPAARGSARHRRRSGATLPREPRVPAVSAHVRRAVIHLRSVALKRPPADGAGFPFSVPAIRTLATIELTSTVTLLVGENGSGKSTLLEAIAAAARLPSVGG